MTKVTEYKYAPHHDSVIKIQEELLNLYEIQIMDLIVMSKIELGDDVLEKIKELKDALKDLK